MWQQLWLSPERQRIAYPSAALFLMTASFILTKTGRDALYFQKNGIFDFPWAYLGIAFFSVPVATVMLSLIRTLGARRARLVAPLGMAGLQVAFYLLAQPGGGWVMTSFFTLIPVVYGVLFSVAWLLGAELLDECAVCSVPGAYATLGAASLLGGVAGGVAAKILADRLVPEMFILLGAGALLASAAVMAVAQASYPVRRLPNSRDGAARDSLTGLMPPLSEMFGALQQRHVRSMLAIAITAAAAGVFIEFQFYALAAASGGGGQENADFFANFYIVLNSAALLLQVWAMPALQRRIGVARSLMVLPLSLFSGALILVVSAAGLGRTALRVAEGGLKSSIHRSNWEQAYLPLARPRRIIAKVMVDGMGAHVAEGVAAALLLVGLEVVAAGQDATSLSTSWVAYLIAVSTLLWFASTILLGRSLTPSRCRDIRDGNLSPSVPPPDCCYVTAALGGRQQPAEPEGAPQGAEAQV